MYYSHFWIKAAQSIPAPLHLTSSKCSFWPVFMAIHKYANRVPAVQHCISEIHIWSHAKLKRERKKRWPWIYFTNWIHSSSFILCRLGPPVLKIKLAKQINHMMRSLADCCCFPPFILLAFFFSLLRSWSCSFLATRVPMDRTRCSRQHTSPLSASWNIHGQPGTAAQHSTAPHRPETTYLLISSPCCLADWDTTTAQRTRGSSHLSASHRPHPPSLTVFLLIGTVLMDT